MPSNRKEIILPLPATYTSEYEKYSDESICDYTKNVSFTLSSSEDSDVKQNLSSRKDWVKSKGFVNLKVDFQGKLPDYTNFKTRRDLPVEYFFKFLNKSMISRIAIATNAYSVQKTHKNITDNEIEQYIGILLHMGVVQMSDYRMFWQTNTRYSPIADILPRSSFDQIKSNFHICENRNISQDEDCVRLFRVRNLYDHVRSNCQSLDVLKYLSIGN